MWTPDKNHPTDHFQMARPYAGSPGRVLFITRRDDAADVTGRFAETKEIEISSTRIGRKKGEDVYRTFHLIGAAGFRPD